MNLPELKKYELLALILQCDKDNARDLMNGTYNSKDRDMTEIFKEFGLKE